MTAAAGAVWRPGDLADYAGSLLLDTHVWVWYLGGKAGRMHGDALPLLDRSGAAGALRVSDISYWEVAVKVAKNVTFSS